MELFGESYGSAVREGLQLCGVDKLFLQIHDASFPSKAEEDIGRGSPYTEGAMAFLGFVHGCGFNGIQLGPQGATARDNASPYDGTIFSRNPLSLPLSEFVAWNLLSEEWVAERLARLDKELTEAGHAHPERVAYDPAWAVMDDALDAAYAEYARNRSQHKVLTAHLDRFRVNNEAWLERDVVYASLFEAHGRRSWRDWVTKEGAAHSDRRLFDPPDGNTYQTITRINAVKARYLAAAERTELAQFLVHHCHLELRHDAAREGLKLYADLQIGMSDQDAWAYQNALMRGYKMGAPPSRTNQQGQPWGFAVLDPAKYMGPDGPGPALKLVIERLRKIYSEYDGVRVDHPHGWVCPWVYRSDVEDPFQAVQGGARLFAAPDLDDHPDLAAFSIARADQLDRDQARHAEHWVKDLTEEQIDQYAQVFGRIVAPDASSRLQLDLVCEVLSTLPYPLKRVLDRYGLGRFRVLQKVDPNNPGDVYRSELAEPVDWIMLGNHDTPPIWKLVRDWVAEGRAGDRAKDLAKRLCPKDEDATRWATETASDPSKLAHALFADLLVSRARNIMVFMSDLLGIEEPYNVPGSVNDINWSLRVPRDYAERYARDTATGQALSLPRALVIALQAPALDTGGADTSALVAQLKQL